MGNGRPRRALAGPVAPGGNPSPHLGVIGSTVSLTDMDLVRRAIDGDERAMQSLWSRYAPRLDAVVRRLVADPDLAADVAQEVWIQIFRALPGFRGDARFGTWAHRIAVNGTLNALRRQRRLSEASLDEEAMVVEPDDERPFVMASIEDAAARLAPGARTVFILHDVEGYTHEEIAESLGITAGGSKSQLFKARAKLRRLLAHLIEDRRAAPDTEDRRATPDTDAESHASTSV
jgi:RNA polymerase sigma-70 factor (ECF subfamily)